MSFTVRLVAGLALMVFLSGCLGGASRKSKNLSVRIIREGDSLYKQREDRKKLDQAIQWYLSGTREFPDSAKIMGRLARAYVVRSYGHPGDGLDGYATARQFGLACLKTEESFGGLVMSTGGEITKKAIATLERDRIGCMTWTSLAWSRWLAERGVAGAGIDLRATISMAQRAVEVYGEYDGGRPWAALGLALALPLRPMEPDLGAARKALDRARQLSPDRLTPVVDIAEFVSAPQGDLDEWRSLLEGVVASNIDGASPDYLENNAAVRRAKALLEAGPTDRWMD